MANSRIMLTCMHCGDQLVIGKGYYGSYHLISDNMSQQLREFYSKHESGICSGDIDCTDRARSHFIILEEGETIKDWLDVVEVVRCKDCQYGCKLWFDDKGVCFCRKLGLDIKPEHFCSYGERRVDRTDP